MALHPPMVLGLTVCEDVVADPIANHVSVIRIFNHLTMDAFPGVARPFCVYAALTDAEGNLPLELVVRTGEGFPEEIHRVPTPFRFIGRLLTVHYVLRLQTCPVPTPGDYTLTLELAGEWLAHRTFQIEDTGGYE